MGDCASAREMNGEAAGISGGICPLACHTGEHTSGCSVLQPSLWLLFLCRVWYWGYLSFYDSSGYVQELGPSLEESRAQLSSLQQHAWIDNM